MNPSVIYKLAFAQDPTVAVAHAAAGVGLPKIAQPIVARAAEAIGRGARGAMRGARRSIPRMERSALSRTAKEIANEPWNRIHPPPIPRLGTAARPFRVTDNMIVRDLNQPGLGRRLMKNWWTLPVGAAGVYGLGKMLGQGEDMVSAFSGSPQMGFGYPESPSPAQGRYQQMMALARQYGYM
jgi:hypothetical protein